MDYSKPTIDSMCHAAQKIEDGTDGLGHRKELMIYPESTTHLTINSTTGAYECDE